MRRTEKHEMGEDRRVVGCPVKFKFLSISQEIGFSCIQNGETSIPQLLFPRHNAIGSTFVHVTYCQSTIKDCHEPSA